MTVKNLEKQLLKLDIPSRAKLATRLLSSLDELSDAENERLWAQEALRRHQELARGNAKAHPAREVLRDARARLR